MSVQTCTCIGSLTVNTNRKLDSAWRPPIKHITHYHGRNVHGSNVATRAKITLYGTILFYTHMIRWSGGVSAAPTRRGFAVASHVDITLSDIMIWKVGRARWKVGVAYQRECLLAATVSGGDVNAAQLGRGDTNIPVGGCMREGTRKGTYVYKIKFPIYLITPQQHKTQAEIKESISRIWGASWTIQPTNPNVINLIAKL